MSIANIADLLHPLSDTSPCGEDAKYELCYELMESEVRKFGSLFGETVDWSVVLSNATEVLSQHSKDIKAACYLTRAWAEKYGFSGLASGLDLMKQLLDQYGSDLHPRRKRARDGALEWLMGQLESSIPRMPSGEVSEAELAGIEESVREIGDRYQQVYSDSEVHFYGLCSVIAPLRQQLAFEAPPAPAEPPATGKTEQPSVVSNEPVAERKVSEPEAAPVVSAQAGQETSLSDHEPDFSTTSASQKTLKKVAEQLLCQDVSASLGYRINRYLTWMDVTEVPPHDGEGVTPIRLAVSQDSIQEYQDIRSPDKTLVRDLERLLTSVPFWLSGHCLQGRFLEQLGWSAAAEAVKQSVNEVLERLPELKTLRFADGTEYLDEAGRKWLEPASIAASAMLVGDSEEEEVTQESFSRVVSEISRRLEDSSSGRCLFINYLKLIKAYHQIGLIPLSLPYIEKIWPMCKEMKLDQWEPELCSQLDALIHITFDSLYPNKTNMPEKYQEWVAIN